MIKTEELNINGVGYPGCSCYAKLAQRTTPQTNNNVKQS